METREVIPQVQVSPERTTVHDTGAWFPNAPLILRYEIVEVERRFRFEERAVRITGVIRVGDMRSLDAKVRVAELALGKAVVRCRGGLRGLIGGGLPKAVSGRTRSLWQKAHQCYRGLPGR